MSRPLKGAAPQWHPVSHVEADMQQLPIILFPGMGADAQMFGHQIAAISQIQVPPWITPSEHESLSAYAERFAGHVNPHRRCYIGGASFGGFVALEMSRHLDVAACFLIGSVQGPEEFPNSLRALRMVPQAADVIPFEIAAFFCRSAQLSGDTSSESALISIMSQFSEADSSFIRWACRAVLEWNGMKDNVPVPVHHIHGGKDHVLPAAKTNADCIIPGAGHLLPITHPSEVTAYIKSKIDNC